MRELWSRVQRTTLNLPDKQKGGGAAETLFASSLTSSALLAYINVLGGECLSLRTSLYVRIIIIMYGSIIQDACTGWCVLSEAAPAPGTL